MELALVATIAIVCIVAVNTLAPKVGIAAPLVLLLLGVVVSLIPAVPAVEIDPEWILAGILPPLLYSTAVSMPAMDFRRDFRTIGGLSVALVVISSVCTGLLFAAIIPEIDVATGIALGAIVSPTDAVATTITRRLGVPDRVITILEGESLLNDATALVLLRSAVAAMATTVSLWGVVGDFVVAVVVAVAIGAVVGRLNLIVRSRIAEATSNTAISFAVPFLAFLPAEHLGASGLVAAVTAGLVTGHGSARYLHARDRIAQAANWRTIELLLEGAIFLIMGLELFALVEDIRAVHGSIAYAIGLGAIAAVSVVIIRAGYVAVILWRLRARRRRAQDIQKRLHELRDNARARIAAVPDFDVHDRRFERFRRAFVRRSSDIGYLLAEPLGRRHGIVLVWAGMRGAVTLAAAQSLPAGTTQRSLLVLVAFVVAAGTLLLQGGTLPLVVSSLGLRRDPASATGHEPDPKTDALLTDLDTAALRVIDQAAHDGLDQRPVEPEVIDRIRRESLHHGQVDPEEPTAVVARQQYRDLRLRVIQPQRSALLEARSLGTYSSATLAAALTVLDADEVSLELRGGSSSQE